jgi:transcription elongation factor Elf1
MKTNYNQSLCMLTKELHVRFLTRKPCIQRCKCEINRVVEGWNLNATRGIKFYVDWVQMVIYSQIKSTCNKDGEVNILSHLPGVCGKKKSL